MPKFAIMLPLLLAISSTAHAAFLQLDSSGNVIGVYWNPQSTIAGLQQVPDNDPRVMAFLAAQAKAMTQQPDRMRRLADLLVAKGVITAADETAMLGQ